MPSVGLPGVVISVYNDAEALSRLLLTLTSLFEEIVVVDNHSEDDCLSVCHEFAVKYIQPPPRMRFSRGQCWNAGATEIKSESLLFLHVDTSISLQAVAQLKTVWHENHCDYSCFRIRFEEKAFKFRILEWVSNFRSRTLKIIYGDQGFCIRAEIFETIGGFPNEYLLEDLKINRFLRPYRFSFINSPIHPSSRKFHQIGFFRYLFLMNQILLLNLCGISTKKLHQRYYSR